MLVSVMWDSQNRIHWKGNYNVQVCHLCLFVCDVHKMLYRGLSHIDLPAKLEKSVSNGGTFYQVLAGAFGPSYLKIYNLCYPDFLSPLDKIFWVLLTSKSRKLKKGFTVLISSQNDNREKISASNDHFARRDLGEFQDKRQSYQNCY